jgi:hypothetical protein
VLANILGLGAWNKEGRKEVSKDFASSTSIFVITVIWVFNYFDGFYDYSGTTYVDDRPGQHIN